MISLKISCCKGFFANRNSVNSIDPFSPGSWHKTTLSSQVLNGKEIPLAKGLKEERIAFFSPDSSKLTDYFAFWIPYAFSNIIETILSL